MQMHMYIYICIYNVLKVAHCARHLFSSSSFHYYECLHFYYALLIFMQRMHIHTYIHLHIIYYEGIYMVCIGFYAELQAGSSAPKGIAETRKWARSTHTTKMWNTHTTWCTREAFYILLHICICT